MTNIENATVGDLQYAIRRLADNAVAWKRRAGNLESDLAVSATLNGSQGTTIRALEKKLTSKQAVLDATVEINQSLEATLASVESKNARLQTFVSVLGVMTALMIFVAVLAFGVAAFQ